MENFRTPHSCTEVFSRLCTCAYHQKYLPIYKILTIPLWQMANSGKFTWTRVHQQCWAALKLLCRLQFETNIVKKDYPLFVNSDASKISVALLTYQIVGAKYSLLTSVQRSSDQRIEDEVHCTTKLWAVCSP